MADDKSEGEEKEAIRRLLPVKPVEAESVEIRTSKSRIVIDRPEVMVMQVMDREVWQISGESHEHPIIVASKTGKAGESEIKKGTVLGKIEELDYGVAKAISEIRDVKKVKEKRA